MINHTRTLLLNVDGSNNPGPDFLAEEFVPADFKARALPTFLATIRTILFGADPDRAMLNYRLRQYLELLHTTPDLSQYVTETDSRITYLPFQDTSLYETETFLPQVTELNIVGDQDLFVQGEVGSVDEWGRLRHEWVLDVSGGSVSVQRTTKPRSTVTVAYTVTDSLSSSIPLHGSGLRVQFRGSSGSSWRVEVFGRPRRDLGVINESLHQVGEPVHLQLFGAAPEEPFKTFRNLFFDNYQMPYQLGGLLLAIPYRMDLLNA